MRAVIAYRPCHGFGSHAWDVTVLGWESNVK